MRLPKVNTILTHKRRSTASGNKKEDVVLQVLIPAFVSDSGTTADHEQTYTILIDSDDVTAEINPDKDTLSDGDTDYKIMNSQKKTHHYSLRCIKTL